MLTTSLDTAATFFKGALSIWHTDSGLKPVRLPDWAWAQTPDALVREMFSMAAGVRLAVTTNATAVELDIAATRLNISDLDTHKTHIAVDLIADGRDADTQELCGLGVRTLTLAGVLVDESPPVVRSVGFAGLPTGTKHLELWLPANATVELHGLRADAPLHSSPDQPRRWIHHGSSISHCSEALRPIETWPAIAARLARVDLLNLGVGGSCHLDPFVARTIRDEPADCISLKVGINIAGGETMKYRTFVPAVHGFLDTIRDGHPQTPLLVISPIICPVLEDLVDKNVLSLRHIREILSEIVDARRRAGDDHLHYIDGLALFGVADVDELPDGLHPSPAGYIRLGERFAHQTFGHAGAFFEAAPSGESVTGAET